MADMCTGLHDTLAQEFIQNIHSVHVLNSDVDVEVGEAIQIIRDLDNSHHKNAFQVLTVDGALAGHLDRTLADFLAPHVDGRSVETVSACIPDGAKVSYIGIEVRLTLRFFAGKPVGIGKFLILGVNKRSRCD
jgi:hypothetical protein